MKLPHLFNNTCTQPNTASYWPTCSQQPKTLSFRSILWDDGIPSKEPPKSSSALIEDLLKEDGGETIERVIRDLKSNRLFFEPEKTNLENAGLCNDENSNGYSANAEKGVTLLSLESRDPYLDFKKSMEEMVEARGLVDWDWLKELLGCYLKVNGKSHHEIIIGAFLELLMGLDLDSLGLSFSSCVASSSSTFSSSSNISTSCCSSSNLPTDDAAVLGEGFGG